MSVIKAVSIVALLVGAVFLALAGLMAALSYGVYVPNDDHPDPVGKMLRLGGLLCAGSCLVLSALP